MDAVEIAGRLGAEGLEPGTWSNGPGDRYSPHEHAYDKVMVCAAGSIRFTPRRTNAIAKSSPAPR